MCCMSESGIETNCRNCGRELPTVPTDGLCETCIDSLRVDFIESLAAESEYYESHGIVPTLPSASYFDARLV